MAEILIKDSDLSGLKGKVVIVTGTYNSCGPSPALESPECHHARETRQPVPRASDNVIHHSLGGSSGIGLATVQLLLSLGASVVNGDVAAPAETPAGSYTFVQTDVANWAQLNALFRKTKETYGRVDHVFANAGLGPRADYLATEVGENGDLKEPSSALMDVSLKGVMNTGTLAIYYMRQQPEGGSLVVCASTMGIQRCRAVDYGGSYLPPPPPPPPLLQDLQIESRRTTHSLPNLFPPR